MSENGHSTREIVAKLWRMCDLLRDGGVTYQDYVTELTYLLFLKMMQETERESVLPSGLRWNDLKAKEGDPLLTFYRTMLLKLGTETKGIVREIFTDAQTTLKYPKDLKELVSQIDRLDWFSAKQDGLGDLYEGLLEKNANEKKSGAGQYFTPRPLIECMVRLIKPQPGILIQDPAAGTGGFLIAADRYIKEQTDELFALPEKVRKFQRNDAFRGLELVHDTHRMLLMNLMLHDIGGEHIKDGDTLSPDGETLGKADLILTNPPFGTKKGGGRPTRTDFSITADTSNKQLAFLEHVVRSLNPGGRAAMVVPDNVLFDDGVGQELRRWLMELCDVHTILRLPTGIFYSPGIKTNVMFFQRGTSDRGNTRYTWIYDMRAGQPAYGKKRPLRLEDFAEFRLAYGEDPDGKSDRTDTGEVGRFRRFGRNEIAALADNLDISWLRDDDESVEDALEDVDDISEAIRQHIEKASAEFDTLTTLTGSVHSLSVAQYPKRRLAEIARTMFDGPFGSNLKTSDYVTSGVRVVRLENIGHLAFYDAKSVYVTPEKAATLRRHVLEIGDVLFSSFIDDEVRVCVFPGVETEAINKADCFCFRADRALCLPEYVALVLASPATYETLRDAVHGATRPRIGLKHLKQYEIPLPPLDVQAQIVQRVHAGIQMCRQTESEARRVAVMMKNYEKAFLRSSFSEDE